MRKNYRQNLRVDVAAVKSHKGSALGHGGAKEITKSCCMWCEPMETAQSLGDDTHAVVIGLTWAREHGLHRGVVPSVGGL